MKILCYNINVMRVLGHAPGKLAGRAAQQAKQAVASARSVLKAYGPVGFALARKHATDARSTRPEPRIISGGKQVHFGDDSVLNTVKQPANSPLKRSKSGFIATPIKQPAIPHAKSFADDVQFLGEAAMPQVVVDWSAVMAELRSKRSAHIDMPPLPDTPSLSSSDEPYDDSPPDYDPAPPFDSELLTPEMGSVECAQRSSDRSSFSDFGALTFDNLSQAEGFHKRAAAVKENPQLIAEFAARRNAESEFAFNQIGSWVSKIFTKAA